MSSVEAFGMLRAMPARRRRVSWQRDLASRLAALAVSLIGLWLILTFLMPWVAQMMVDNYASNFLPSPSP